MNKKNWVTIANFSPSDFNRLSPENKALTAYDRPGQSFSHSADSKSFFRNVLGLRMPTQQTSKVSNRFSKLRNNDARLTPDFKDNSPQRCKKRSQKTKFRMAYKVTMHSMPNLPKGLIWGIKWNAIKFWANYPVLRTFHPKDRIPSDPPTKELFW